MDVITEISPLDEMFDLDLESYLAKGEEALRLISLAAQAAPRDGFARILDLPCGYGRVLRHLRVAYPKADITACDIQREGVDFCAEKLGARPVYRADDLEGEFDLIWCGSLLTHLPLESWRGWLDLFEAHLAPYGVLVFTVQGRRVFYLLDKGVEDHGVDPKRLLADYAAQGSGYENYPGQDGYGFSLTSPSYVCSLIEDRPGLRLLLYREMAWNHFQDAVACLAAPIDRIFRVDPKD